MSKTAVRQFWINSGGDMGRPTPGNDEGWGHQLIENTKELTQRERIIYKSWDAAADEFHSALIRFYAGIDKDDKDYLRMSTEFIAVKDAVQFWNRLEEWVKANGGTHYTMDEFIDTDKSWTNDPTNITYGPNYGKEMRHESVDFDVFGKSSAEMGKLRDIIKAFCDEPLVAPNTLAVL